jgi:hypothetical protein
LTHKKQHPDYKYQPRRKKIRRGSKHGKHYDDYEDEDDEKSFCEIHKKATTSTSKPKTKKAAQTSTSINNNNLFPPNFENSAKNTSSEIATPSSSSSSVEQYSYHQNMVAARYNTDSPANSIHSATDPLTPPSTPYTGLTSSARISHSPIAFRGQNHPAIICQSHHNSPDTAWPQMAHNYVRYNDHEPGYHHQPSYLSAAPIMEPIVDYSQPYDVDFEQYLDQNAMPSKKPILDQMPEDNTAAPSLNTINSSADLYYQENTHFPSYQYMNNWGGGGSSSFT